MDAGDALNDAVGAAGGGGGGGGGGSTFFLHAPSANTSISAKASINRFFLFNSSSKFENSGPRTDFTAEADRWRNYAMKTLFTTT